MGTEAQKIFAKKKFLHRLSFFLIFHHRCQKVGTKTCRAHEAGGVPPCIGKRLLAPGLG
jgi:hypothetical protein